jgi:hypothetical protein
MGSPAPGGGSPAPKVRMRACACASECAGACACVRAHVRVPDSARVSERVLRAGNWSLLLSLYSFNTLYNFICFG